ncbi:MAG: IS66 family insertion sequence element accessory protein TnpB [Candidatus Obscuribacterales bacterium]|nr:IS66 family insertion sequence element accessory protein TnpB [Candidatus Obscuribacterales bacterium]
MDNFGRLYLLPDLACVPDYAKLRITGHLFLFRSKRGNYIKVLWWDSDGFAIFAKKLDVGTFRFPTVKFVDGAYKPIEIERSDLLLLLEGIDTDSVKRLKRYRRTKDKRLQA